MSPIKHIFFEWIGMNSAKNKYTFEFWAKPGRTDKIKASVTLPTEGAVRLQISAITGLQYFTLEKVSR